MKVQRTYYVPLNGEMARVSSRYLDTLTTKNRDQNWRVDRLYARGWHPPDGQTCERCHCGDKRLEGHHSDYAKPLSVEWFCRACHMAHHAELRIQVCESLGGHVVTRVLPNKPRVGALAIKRGEVE